MSTRDSDHPPSLLRLVLPGARYFMNSRRVGAPVHLCNIMTSLCYGNEEGIQNKEPWGISTGFSIFSNVLHAPPPPNTLHVKEIRLNNKQHNMFPLNRREKEIFTW